MPRDSLRVYGVRALNRLVGLSLGGVDLNYLRATWHECGRIAHNGPSVFLFICLFRR